MGEGEREGKRRRGCGEERVKEGRGRETEGGYM